MNNLIFIFNKNRIFPCQVTTVRLFMVAKQRHLFQAKWAIIDQYNVITTKQ